MQLALVQIRSISSDRIGFLSKDLVGWYCITPNSRSDEAVESSAGFIFQLVLRSFRDEAVRSHPTAGLLSLYDCGS